MANGFEYTPWLIFQAAFYITCWPCFALYSKSVKVHKKEVIKSTWPKPLPRKRRSLSINGSLTIQTRSGFMSLPFEIRQMIFTYVVGKNIIYIIHWPERRRLTHLHNRYDVPYTNTYHSRVHFTANSAKNTNGKLGLLRTCRAIYLEAIIALYASNTFAFSGRASLSILMAFAQTVRAPRLIGIRTLQLRVELYEEYYKRNTGEPKPRRHPLECQWPHAWEMIATQMLGLQSLSVKMERLFVPGGQGFYVTDGWVAPMFLVRGLTRFDLKVVWTPNIWHRRSSDAELEEFKRQVAVIEQHLRQVVCSPRRSSAHTREM